MNKSMPDLILLSNYIADPKRHFSSDDFYRTMSAAAFFYLNNPEENHLSRVQRGLLAIRRKLFNGTVEKENLLQELIQLEAYDNCESALVRGDLKVVKGNILQQLGEFSIAARLHSEASKLFLDYGYEFRALRANINSKIYSTITPTSYESGELKILLQQALRSEYHDLCGNIYRGLAIELFNLGKYAEARVQIDAALNSYRLLSYPDEEAIAICLSALIWLQLGQPEKAKADYEAVNIKSRKLYYYIEALKSCLVGKKPTLPTYHPLSRAEWSRFSVRSQSVAFKIIELLKQGPLSRDEIIYTIWGHHALSESYCNRLYVTLNQIRKRKMAQIIFNGDKYELRSTY